MSNADENTRQQWPEHRSRVHSDGIERSGVPEVVARYQAGDKRLPRRVVERDRGGAQSTDRVDCGRGDAAGFRQTEEDECAQREQSLRDEQYAPAAMDIRNR